ncbi:MAG: nuclear transport factor 2 family protein [Actinomycetota bacterium]|nr:nuclear transport factor 2 family protein [Actinomycetota bacterium]
MDRADVERWVAEYERAWRTPGTEALSGLFTPDVSYVPSPWAPPIRGLDALGAFWVAERKGPDEEFAMTSEVVAVEGSTAVVRVSVDYGEPLFARWRDLWVIRFAADERCEAFEEWPFAPDQRDGHE